MIASGISSGTPPEVLDPRYVLELFAAAPDIVTPTGCTHDEKGRLLVIESHTHHRPEGYVGPAHDRIRLIEDTDGDGRADRFRTFYEGTKATMGLRRGPAGAEGWIYVATRSAVFRIRDTDGDDVADAREDLLALDTTGDYPHNGLGSMAFDADGRLVIGLGENLGVPYKLAAADGSSWSGEGEGAALQGRARADKSKPNRKRKKTRIALPSLLSLSLRFRFDLSPAWLARPPKP